MNLNGKIRIVFTFFLAFSLIFILYHEFSYKEGFTKKIGRSTKKAAKKATKGATKAVSKATNGATKLTNDAVKGATKITNDSVKGATKITNDAVKGATKLADQALDVLKSLDFTQFTKIIQNLIKDVNDVSKSVTSISNKINQ